MNNYRLSSSILLSAMFLVACGDDNSSTPSSNELPNEVADLAELNAFHCSKDFIGDKVYVMDIAQSFECDGNEWFEVPKAKSASSSSKTEKSSSSKKAESSQKSSSSSAQTYSSSQPKSSSSRISSSSVQPKSSSSATSSSASDIAPPCKNDSTDTCEYGTLIDDRDNQTYKTVKIRKQIWMAENLNYASARSNCYNDEASNCTKYGRLYTWNAAMDSAGLWSTNGKGCGYAKYCKIKEPVRGVCPSGWHLPSEAEWSVLLRSGVGGRRLDGSRTSAGDALKSTTGWNPYGAKEVDGNGMDSYGFHVLPAGYKSDVFSNEGNDAIFWTSTESDGISTDAEIIEFSNYGSTTVRTNRHKYYSHSIRCVKDDPSSQTINSSSSEQSSSSNVQDSSSSETLPPPCNVETDENCFMDSRDGQTYRTVYIAQRIWMAENLNYKTANSDCYYGDSSYCAKYGRLYQWSTAVDTAGVWSTAGKGCSDRSTRCSIPDKARGICPEGWHLPGKEDWVLLRNATDPYTMSGQLLKSTTDWIGDGNGTDQYGFNALPAGNEEQYGLFDNIGWRTCFWSTTEDFSDRAQGLCIYSNKYEASNVSLYKWQYFSIRCIKD